MNTKKYIRVLAIFLLVTTSCRSKQMEDKTGIGSPQTADVIVYGGTSAAITTAVQVKKMGKSVIVISPDKHLGGLSSSGLGYTDTGNKEVIGGLSREFYQRIYNYYAKDSAWKWQTRKDYGNVGQGTPAIDGANRTMWIFEPHVAEQVFEDFVSEYNIPVVRDAYLNRESGIVIKDGNIQSITTTDGQRYSGTVFIDATYEGDLMALAGIPYTVGRESNTTYGERWNGVQTNVFQHPHNFGDLHVSPYKVPGDPNSGLVMGVSKEGPGNYGEADDKVQAYNFRMCLTQLDENKVPFKKPANYNPERYELLARVYAKGWDQTFQKFDPIPNLKTDTNNHGPFNTDYIGMSYDYPEAGYKRRKEIVKEHREYQQGLMYFIATDPRIPGKVREEFKKWGYAKDEFQDNGNWPYQIYVREARRMLGQFVMTENEILGKKKVEKSIGMGSYTMDSHNVQRYITKDGFVQNEGDIGVHPHEPYKIDLGTILPKKGACTNLIVPVAVSSSHIAFGSIRMEPVFMILGQSAATLAVMAIETSKAVQDIAYADLKAQLLKDGQRLELEKH
ncbi:FAD-dependent oxidoreductase [Galbibacter pacificus]|uniref:FAD-dependent oxidoreductase n=1 Tax=Galbibacter pacificus TaxID=2996052 RepID=A0ABT6FN64_9FLAO|nr:FAD-dependent oxidoreductase [Galbibacter pacificus]MDG3581172.1 FAD-dependent oxidoreductase [Galbibacter pacificus]MDG3584650.1 FAD-dependent oxidoreductase [Galbibacter pacificus]